MPLIPSSLKKGIYTAGVAENPMDVARTTRKATSSAIKAIQGIKNEKIGVYICTGCGIEEAIDID